MFENIANFFKRLIKSETKETPSKETAKERLHLVLMQDRANVSADFLELMKQEIIEVIKKYIEVEESAIDVRLTNEVGDDGKQGAPSLYANIPILNIKNNMKNENTKNVEEDKNSDNNLKEDIKGEKIEQNKEVDKTNNEQAKKIKKVKQKDEKEVKDQNKVEEIEEKSKEAIEKKENEKKLKEENEQIQLEENSINDTKKVENKNEEKTSQSKTKAQNSITQKKKNNKK